ncbi:MAG: hypothetical protein ABH840_00710 [Nanoarchaeota archaeon]
MKRVLLGLFILFSASFILFSASLVSALNIDMKSSFQPGETILGSIEANFLTQLTPQNIYFYSDRVSIPLVFDIAKINDKYYFYVILPIQERDYTMIIKDAHYFENGQEQLRDIETNFSVSGNITEFSVYPGFIITKNNFTLSLESKNQALDVTIKVQNQSIQVNLPIAKTKKVDLTVNSNNFTMEFISVSSQNTNYNIPIAILSSNTSIYQPRNISENITDSEKFRFSKSKLNLSVNEDSELTYDLYLVNVGDKDLGDINLVLEGDINSIATLNLKTLDLKESETKKIELTINPENTGVFRGEIRAETDNLSTSIDIVINSFSKDTEIPIPNPDTKDPCVVYDGIICDSAQQCSSTVIDSSEGECCLGKCENKTSYTTIIIGILILIVVLVGLFFLYKRQKATKSPSSKEIVQKTSQDFEKRVLGQEVRKSLTRS